MMPFYYGSMVRSVPEYLRPRYDDQAHLLNALTFVVSSLLLAGVNLYALVGVIDALLGVPLWVAIVVPVGSCSDLRETCRGPSSCAQRVP